MIVSQLKSGQMNFDLRLIVIDSLSSLVNACSNAKAKQLFSVIKELLYLFKTLTKRHFVGVVYTNNLKDPTST